MSGRGCNGCGESSTQPRADKRLRRARKRVSKKQQTLPQLVKGGSADDLDSKTDDMFPRVSCSLVTA